MSGTFTASLEDLQVWASSLMDSREPDFIIGDNYLRRWWVIPRNNYQNVYLHDIRKSDDDRALHDHPWANTSLLIYGAYIEHTPQGVFRRTAGDVVTRSADSLHRLEVIPGQRAISLFVTGSVTREWGFRCDHGWVHWKDFVSSRDKGQVGAGCGEHDNLSPTRYEGTVWPDADATARGFGDIPPGHPLS